MKIYLELLQEGHLEALFIIKNNKNVLKSIPGDYPLDKDSFLSKNRDIIKTDKGTELASFVIIVDGDIAGLSRHFIRDGNDSIEVGYFIGENWWGKGIASKALRLHLIEMKSIGIIGEIIGSHAKGNIASGRVLEKSGFVQNGEIKFNLPDGTSVMDPLWVKTL